MDLEIVILSEVTQRKTNTTWYHLYVESKIWHRDFPGGPVIENLPSNAGDTGPIPGRGTKIPHAVGQLSQHAAPTEPARHN